MKSCGETLGEESPSLQHYISSVTCFRIDGWFLFSTMDSDIWTLLLLHCYCASVQGLHPLKDSAFLVLQGEPAAVKCDVLAFGAFPGWVTRCFTLTLQFLSPRPAKATIYATRCRHFLSLFLSFFLSFFLGRAKDLGICEDSSGASSKNREKKDTFGGALGLGQPLRGVVM